MFSVLLRSRHVVRSFSGRRLVFPLPSQPCSDCQWVASSLTSDTNRNVQKGTLDRSNLGNAKTAGLSKDPNLKGEQYKLLLTLYYVMFVLFGPVMAVLLAVGVEKQNGIWYMCIFFCTIG